ncbi:MAG: hypothetical protein RIG84_19945 [Roseovarius sp.]
MHRWVTRLFILTTIGPILFWIGCFVVVTVLTNRFDCIIHEGFVNPCMVYGRDVGETAAMLFVLGAWGPLIFGPVVMASAMAWALYALLRAARRRFWS